MNRSDHLIYLADDSETVRKMVSYVLGKVGYQVKCFNDGQELLDDLYGLQDDALPSVIILDYNMPNVDGFQACYQIKSNMARLKAPIIFFTSMANTEDSAMEAGADEFIVKPFQPNSLIERIDYWAKEDTHWALNENENQKGDNPLIMIADDSEHFRKMVSLILQNAGFHVEAYEDGFDLICNLEGKEPKVIVLDMEMPKLNGLDTCKKIRLEWEQLNCPILFFTSQASSETIRNIREIGGNDYVNKSLPPDVLAERVHHWMKSC
ncbi:hypothetical protein MTBPR1_20016 [Candidatus Terasakiella magnetica]|uniref:Response regulatory domain-containing protein n=1 Tax=Candidatus Terasakiella magnetica TaxID=1867952 RepID=A0A1C3RFY8_9PROT|nr:response regulator [Candidatus Terasakiella magnetica]SCA56168.1 hypothetical protein MTBPR1_20016 [Candidatus Terasakiella magnetica]